MVKPADKRASKYASKFDATVISSRYTALKDLATSEQTIQAAAMVQMEEQVKAYLESEGSVDSHVLIPNYLAFARQIYAKQRKYGGAILTAEVERVGANWGARGLSKDVLTGIAALFGVTATIHW